jgi:hypothetical protein
MANSTLAMADLWKGCVEVSNTSGIDVTATVEGYPGWSWKGPAFDSDIKTLVINGSQPIVMQADSHDRPPIHFQPSNIGMLWNFFTRTDPGLDAMGCGDRWRIVVVRSPCNSVVDNICQ